MRFALSSILAAALILSACQRTEDPVEPADTAVVTETPAAPVVAPPQEEIGETPAATAPLTATAEPGSCRAEVGAVASARLVERCIQVSPATRPPCNAANPCALIQGEIDRACAMFGTGDVPAECAA